MYTNKSIVDYYQTFESREEKFRSCIFNVIPRKYAGAFNFWTDFTSLKIEDLEQLYYHPIAYLTCRPQDSLAFGTPLQVLKASILTLYKHNINSNISLDEIITMFSLKDFLFQPIRTISGGESVKLALAKQYILSEFSPSLIISSPFSWLAEDNTYLLDLVVSAYLEKNKQVRLLALENEDSVKPNFASSTQNISEIPFTLRLKDVIVNLDSAINTDTSNETNQAFLSDGQYDLISPCLLSGSNGQGKSLTAYILSRAVEYNGEAIIETSGMLGFAKMLFQDVFTQKLLRSFEQIITLFSYHKNESPTVIYQKLINEFISYFRTTNKKVPLIGFDETLGTHTLLEIKFILVASRLSIKPNLLILDEPDWGFTQDTAIGFVISIIKVSHSLGIPIMIISHKDWWFSIIKSILTAHKEIFSPNKIQIYFTKI